MSKLSSTLGYFHPTTNSWALKGFWWMCQVWHKLSLLSLAETQIPSGPVWPQWMVLRAQNRITFLFQQPHSSQVLEHLPPKGSPSALSLSQSRSTNLPLHTSGKHRLYLFLPPSLKLSEVASKDNLLVHLSPLSDKEFREEIRRGLYSFLWLEMKVCVCVSALKRKREKNYIF